MNLDRLKCWMILFLLFCSSTFFTQSQERELKQELQKNLMHFLDSGIEFMDQTQITKTIPGKQYKGEWPCTMEMSRSFFYLGLKKKKADDSNCFSVSATHNALAQIYLLYPEYENLADVLNLSFSKVLSYKNENQFNFWNLLPPTIKLKRDDVLGEQGLVRRPTNFPLKYKYIHNAANIANDADDTSIGYLAICLNRTIFGGATSDSILEIEPIFNGYTDQDRNNRHWYNHLRGNDHETGAYLTWLGSEYQFKNWSILKTTYHNGIWFHKSSECYPHPYVPYIPYGSNDLDAVVNADILSLLGYNDEFGSEGFENAVDYVELKSVKNQNKIGIYYPNRYHFSYAVSEAYANGVIQLDTSMINLIEFICKSQNSDGSFSSRRRLNKRDVVQSTAYALNALVNYGDFENKEIISGIENSIDFLMKESIEDEHGIHWTGGVFFSGGTLIRNMLVWKSDAYTTSIILKAFANYNKHLESNIVD